MRLQVLMFKQDDPKKCTAAKIVKFNLAKRVRNTFSNTLLLDPFATRTLLNSDSKRVESITGIDCSWELADQVFLKKFPGMSRRLPPLLAGNPVNYSKLGKLTTVEALAGASYMMGFSDLAESLLSKFKWGHTFFELNQNLLKDYSEATSEDEINSIRKEYNLD